MRSVKRKAPYSHKLATVMTLLMFSLTVVPCMRSGHAQIQAVSYWLCNPVTLDGVITSPNEWAESVVYGVSLERHWGWPDEQVEPSNKSLNVWFKNDEVWLYVLYQIPWPVGEIDSARDVGTIMHFPQTYAGISDAGWIGTHTDDAYGWNGTQWSSDVEAGGQDNVEGAASYDDTCYWFEFRKMLDSGDGVDWSFTPGEFVGHPDDHVILGIWDASTESLYSQWVSLQLAFNSPEEPYQIEVALYNGSGAWYGGTMAMKKMFEWMDCIVTTIQVEDMINGVLESQHFDVLAWPGGHYPAYWEVGQEGKANIQKFIRDGGGYMGICAGAWWACDYMVWMADSAFPDPPYKVEGDQSNLDLFPGVARGPIEEITPFYTGTMARINIVNHNHPVTESLPDHMQILYWGGPHLLPYNTADVTILGTYDATGTPAIVAFGYGNGRVFLTGPHPEVEENSDRDGLPPIDPGWSDPESEWPLLLEATKWLASINRMETDLNRDGTVNILDVAIIALAFGSTPEDPTWNVIADLNNDQLVNILDVAIVAVDYGKTV